MRLRRLTKLFSLLLSVVMILQILCKPMTTIAADEQTSFNLSQVTLGQLESAGYISYFLFVDHYANNNPQAFHSIDEMCSTGHIRCFIEFNPRPFVGTEEQAREVVYSNSYSFANPQYVFNGWPIGTMTEYAPEVLQALGYYVFEIHFDRYPGVNPTSFTLPILLNAGYMTMVDIKEYDYNRRNKFNIANTAIYSTYGYVDYAFRIFREKFATGGFYLLPNALWDHIPRGYEDAVKDSGGILNNPYGSNLDAHRSSSDRIDIPQMPSVGITSL